jgi:hypothetical protein
LEYFTFLRIDVEQQIIVILVTYFCDPYHTFCLLPPG